MQITFETYTAAEAERMTEVKQATLRGWRREGMWPRRPGHAKYHILEIATMLVMGCLSERGLGVSKAVPFAQRAAEGVLAHVLMRPDAYNHDLLHTFCAAASRSLIQEKFHESNPDLSDEDLAYVAEAEALRALRQLIESKIGRHGTRADDFLFVWSNNALEFWSSDDEDHPFVNIDYRKRDVQGAAIMLCLGGLAWRLATKLPRPPIVAVGR